MGEGLLMRSFKRLTGIPKPIAPPDFIAKIQITFPLRSRVGLPLLPGSIGIATWTKGRPSPNSSSRIAEITPRVTL